MQNTVIVDMILSGSGVNETIELSLLDMDEAWVKRMGKRELPRKIQAPTGSTVYKHKMKPERVPKRIHRSLPRSRGR